MQDSPIELSHFISIFIFYVTRNYICFSSFDSLYSNRIQSDSIPIMDDQFLKYLNLARQNPKHYISLLQSQLSSFVNNYEIPLNEEIMYQSNQGKSAWIQAKHFLLKQPPIQPLIFHSDLCKAATDHRKDICRHGTLDHVGTDGSTFCQRILRYCKKGPGAMAQMIGLDFDIKDRNIAQLTILSLIIDDGVSDRGHRQTIFNPTYKYVGWSVGTQGEKIVTVFNLLENNLEGLDRILSSTNKQNPNERINKNGRRQIRILGSWEEVPLRDILNTSSSKQKNIAVRDDYHKMIIKPERKMSEKQQKTKTVYQNGATIIEKIVRVVYKDGTIEENVDTKTIYDDDQ